MENVTRQSFYATSSSKNELLNVLLVVCGLTISSYAIANQTEVGKIEENIDWAINSLANEIDLNLRLIGYIAKDSRVEGLFFNIVEVERKLRELSEENGSSLVLSIHLNVEDIVTKEISIDTRFIVNSTALLERALIV